MFNLNVPKRTIAFIQVWASVLLIAIAFAVSFCPIVTINTSENAEEIQGFLNEAFETDDIEIPEKVDVTVLGLFNSGKFMVEMLNLASKGTSVETSEEGDALAEELEEMLKTEEGKKMMVTTAVIAGPMFELFENEENADGETIQKSLFEILMKAMLAMCVLLGIVCITLILPVILGFKALIALIRALVKINDPEKVAPKISTSLCGVLGLALMIILCQGIIEGLAFGFGIIVILSMAIATVLLNVAISRTVNYNKDQFMYINLVQGASVVGILGFLMFFTNLLKTNILSNFVNGNLTEYLRNVNDIQRTASAQGLEATVDNGYVLDIVCIMMYVVFVLISLGYIKRAVRRLSCTAKSGDNNLLASGILALPVFILPVLVKKAERAYPEINGVSMMEEKVSFLSLSNAEESALTMVLVGIIIMICVEIALMVLKSVLCKGMSKEDKKAISSGLLMYSDDEVEAENANQAPANEKEKTNQN